MGRNGDLENVARRFVSVFSKVPASYHVLGRDMDEDGGCGEENVDLLGSQDLSEGGLRGGGGGR